MTQLQPLHATTQGRPSPHRPAGLLVVTVDRLPAWMLSFSGATWMATPALDALAARGIVFDRVITPSLEVRDTLRDLAADPAGRSLFGAAKAAGWRAAVVTDDATVAAGMALETASAGGDAPRLVEAVAKERLEADEAGTCIARLVDAAVAVIAAGEHRLVWCHVGSLGVAWDAPPSYRERYVDPEDPPPPSGAGVPGFAVDARTDPDLVVGVRHVFAGQVTLLDSQLGRLFAAVGQGGSTAESGVEEKETRVRPWAVLVVGVRGLPLGLHGWVGTGGRELPYGESIHVPSILVDAAGRMAAQRHGGLVTPADLGATLQAMLDDHHRQPQAKATQAAAIGPEAPWHGASLAGLFDDWSAPVRDRVVAVGRDGAATVTPSWHGLLVRPDLDAAEPAPDGQAAERCRLFAKPDDAFELADVADRCGEVADRLTSLTDSALRGDRDRAWLGPPPAEGTP